MNKTEQFLQAYRKLESAGAEYYDLPRDEKVVASMERLPQLAHEKVRLRYCRDVRNLITHEKLAHDFPVLPSDQMIEFLESLVERLIRIPRCKDYAIKPSKIFACTIDDLVLPAMTTMKEQNYTHVPIMENGVVKGVFSENTLFAYLLDNEIINVDKETRFSELATYLPVDRHVTEKFYFMHFDARVYEAKTLFEDALSRMQRIGMIFLTQNGKPNEKLLGILTPWDILGK